MIPVKELVLIALVVGEVYERELIHSIYRCYKMCFIVRPRRYLLCVLFMYLQPRMNIDISLSITSHLVS